MRLALLCLCISGWWASLSSPSLAISVKYLAHASRDGDIVVRAHSFVGFQITALHILNQRDTDLELDVNGSYLRPRVEGVQRIGIVRGGSGSSGPVEIVHDHRGYGRDERIHGGHEGRGEGCEDASEDTGTAENSGSLPGRTTQSLKAVLNFSAS